MKRRRNWLPNKRVDVLVMANRWKVVLAVKALLWGIPDALVQELIQAIMEAQAALDAASPAIRTAVLTAKVEAAFAKPDAAMRFMKDRYFKKPPLEDEDFVSPGLVPRDTKPAPVAKPESHVLLALHYQGFDTVTIEWSVMPGDPEVDDDCRIEIGRRTGRPVLNGFPIRAPKRAPSGLPRSAGSLWNSRRLAPRRRHPGTGRGAQALPRESAGFRQGARQAARHDPRAGTRRV